MRGSINNTKNYYKGQLFSASKGISSLPKVITERRELAFYDNKAKKMTFLNPELFTKEEQYNLLVYLRSITREDCGVSRSDIVEIFNRLFSFEEAFQKWEQATTDLDKEIIFTAYMDNDGNLYGREIHSNFYFPIITPKNVNTEYRIITSYSEDDNEERYEIVANYKVLVTMMENFSTIISSPTLASLDEVENYTSLFKGFFGSKRLKVYQDDMAYQSRGNIPIKGVQYIEIPDLESVLEPNESLEGKSLS